MDLLIPPDSVSTLTRFGVGMRQGTLIALCSCESGYWLYGGGDAGLAECKKRSPTCVNKGRFFLRHEFYRGTDISVSLRTHVDCGEEFVKQFLCYWTGLPDSHLEVDISW